MIPTFFLVIIPRKITKNNKANEPICIIQIIPPKHKVKPFLLFFKRRKGLFRGTTLIHPAAAGCTFSDTGLTTDILLSANGQAPSHPTFPEPGFQMAAQRPVQLLSPCALSPAGRSLEGSTSLLFLFVAFEVWN